MIESQKNSIEGNSSDRLSHLEKQGISKDSDRRLTLSKKLEKIHREAEKERKITSAHLDTMFSEAIAKTDDKNIENKGTTTDNSKKTTEKSKGIFALIFYLFKTFAGILSTFRLTRRKQSQIAFVEEEETDERWEKTVKEYNKFILSSNERERFKKEAWETLQRKENYQSLREKRKHFFSELIGDVLTGSVDKNSILKKRIFSLKLPDRQPMFEHAKELILSKMPLELRFRVSSGHIETWEQFSRAVDLILKGFSDNEIETIFRDLL